jgi:hypothetical protein
MQTLKQLAMPGPVIFRGNVPHTSRKLKCGTTLTLEVLHPDGSLDFLIDWPAQGTGDWSLRQAAQSIYDKSRPRSAKG